MRALCLLFLLSVTVTAASGFPAPPLGLDLYMPVPETNPLTRENVARGRMLFHDKRLSRDRTIACTSCHDPSRAFATAAPIPTGVFGRHGRRNAPALLNRGYGRVFFWDGRSTSLEQQVLEPIQDPNEMDLTIAEATSRVGLDEGGMARALAAYVRGIRSGDSPFDRYSAGRSGALTDIEKTGLLVFRGKGNCTVCHIGPNFTDERFHNTGIAWRPQDTRTQDTGCSTCDPRISGVFADPGRFAVSEIDRDRGAFKTPTLREISRTAPYMHDGSLTTLEAVIDFYDQGGRANPYLDPEMRPRRFTADEKAALVAFLRTLSGRVREGWK